MFNKYNLDAVAPRQYHWMDALRVVVAGRGRDAEHQEWMRTRSILTEMLDFETTL